MATYRINYTQVVSQVHVLESQADQMGLQISALARMEQDCPAYWKGAAASAFLSKLDSLLTELVRTQAQLFTLASTIQSCADRIQQEDRAAQERASALNSGR